MCSGHDRGFWLFSAYLLSLLLNVSVAVTDVVHRRPNEVYRGHTIRAILPPWSSYSHKKQNPMILDDKLPLGGFHSQSDEDKIAEERYFHNLQNGFFLEMGALDGVTLSNTKFFEESRGWRGLLIEPNPEEYNKLFVNRPNAISVNAAICAQKQDVHFIAKRGDSQSSAGVFGGIWELMSKDFKRDWYNTEDVMPDGATLIPCMPLQAVFEKFGINHIDFYSLDVEGAELDVLQTVDFSATHINVIVVEQDNSNPEKDEAVRQLLLANNFKIDKSVRTSGADFRNEWFVNKTFKPSAASSISQ